MDTDNIYGPTYSFDIAFYNVRQRSPPNMLLQEQKGSRGITPLILNFGARWG
jgi:hypothetical protein